MKFSPLRRSVQRRLLIGWTPRFIRFLFSRSFFGIGVEGVRVKKPEVSSQGGVEKVALLLAERVVVDLLVLILSIIAKTPTDATGLERRGGQIKLPKTGRGQCCLQIDCRRGIVTICDVLRRYDVEDKTTRVLVRSGGRKRILDQMAILCGQFEA